MRGEVGEVDAEQRLERVVALDAVVPVRRHVVARRHSAVAGRAADEVLRVRRILVHVERRRSEPATQTVAVLIRRYSSTTILHGHSQLGQQVYKYEYSA